MQSAIQAMDQQIAQAKQLIKQHGAVQKLKERIERVQDEVDCLLQVHRHLVEEKRAVAEMLDKLRCTDSKVVREAANKSNVRISSDLWTPAKDRIDWCEAAALVYIDMSSDRSSTHTPVYTQVEIKPRGSYTHTVAVDEPTHRIKWSFYTRKKNIAFGLFYLYANDQHPDDTISKMCVRDIIANSRKSVVFKSQQQPIRTIASTSDLSIHDSKGGGSPEPEQPLNRQPSIEVFASPPLLAVHAAAHAVHAGSQQLLEILPVERYESAENTICGSYVVPLSGSYVLCFDNSFSINTPKQLLFSVTTHPPGPDKDDGQDGGFGGWLLKKKRRRMQGWAKRWFQLDQNGFLSYYEHPHSYCRGVVDVGTCMVTKVPHRRLLTIDSVAMTFHLKALSEQDYVLWSDRLHTAKLLKAKDPVPLGRVELYDEKIRAAIEESHQRLNDLKALAANDDGSVRHLAQLEHSFQALNGLYSLLTEYAKALQHRRRSIVSDNKMSPGDISFDDALSFESVEIFYDADVISDVSDSEDTNLKAMQYIDEFVLEVPESEPPLGPLSLPPSRTALPAPAPPCNISIASILRKSMSIGRDFGSAPMPVVLNEPLSALQRLCEELEYSELLDRAAEKADPLERLLFVTAFAVSGYASGIHRFERKPFNPMLGETFEFECHPKGFRFISEKVCHRPLVVACHARSDRWVFWQDQKIKSKFWGKSVEYTPSGRLHVQFSDTHDHYSWSKVVTCIRNVISSNKWVENYGDMVVTNHQTGDQAKVTFKSNGGFFGSSAITNELAGTICGSDSTVISVSGRWDAMFCREIDSVGQQLNVIWRTNPMPPNYREYYGFTQFAILLNELPPHPRIAPTDSRFRPDQRLLEEARVPEAEEEKARIEALQRETRAKLEESGAAWKPLWFDFSPPTPDDPEGFWKYNEGYWEAKAKGDWSMAPVLW